MVIKNLLWLGLVGYVAVAAVMLFAVGPKYRAGADENILTGMEAQVAQLAAQGVEALDADALSAAAGLQPGKRTAGWPCGHDLCKRPQLLLYPLCCR